jgi:hypothetical protein
MSNHRSKVTGRGWGQKKPHEISKQYRNDDGVKTVTISADFWVGPTNTSETGYYTRDTWDESAGFYVQMGGGTKTFHPRKPTTCSFEADLAKALR